MKYFLKFCFVASLCLTPVMVFAGDPVTIDMTQELVFQDTHIPDTSKCEKKPDGTPDMDHCKPLTLGAVIVRSLFTTSKSDEKDGQLRFQEGLLALKIADTKFVAIRAEDIALIKTKLKDTQAAIILALTIPLLDPADKPTEK